jgi:Spy/CpxP family protein refolding chaperone
MRAKVLILVALMGISAVLAAQPNKNGQKKSFHRTDRDREFMDKERGPAYVLNLTEEQKEAFKQSMLAMQKQLQPIRNELGETEAHQKTLMTAEKPDMAAINKNIEKIGALKIEIAKIEAKHHQDMRARLTDEQRLKFDMFKRKLTHNRETAGMKLGMRM